MAKRKSSFEQLAEARGARVGKGSFEITFRERVWRVDQVPAGRGQPPHLRLRCASRPLPPLVMRRETPLDGRGKRWGINRELTTGDQAFDALVYLESDVADDLVRDLVGVRGFREAVRGLIEGGWSVELGREGLAVRAPTDADPAALRARFDAALGPLDALAVACERFPAGPYRMLRGRHRPAVASAAAILLSMVAPFGFIWGQSHLRLVDETPVVWAALAGVPLWGLCVALLGLLVRGRSTSLRHLGVAAVMLLLGAPMGSMSALYLANGWLDRSSAAEHRTVVVGARVVQSKNVVFRLALASWRDGSGGYELNVGEEDFRRLGTPGTKVVLRTRAGALGLPWIEGIAAAEPPPRTR